MRLAIENPEDMELLGARLAMGLQGGEIIFLKGELGAGKTTLVRGLLRGLGHAGKVKSPTYTLVEMYVLATQRIYHFDLYRLQDPEELEELGIRDYCEEKAVCLFEWPEQAAGVIPEADLVISIQHAGTARKVRLSVETSAGRHLLRDTDLADFPFRPNTSETEL